MRLVLAGGGTGGHIVPNVALIQGLKKNYKEDELKLLYIGSRSGMEKKMIREIDVDFKGVFCGKIRRYFSWENFLDLLKIPVGIVQSFFILLGFRPKAVFCKGGYVSFPVAFAAWILRIPVVLHESDVVPGLSNKAAAWFAKVICVSYEDSKRYFPNHKIKLTGNPIRKELVEGTAEAAREYTGFKEELPVILVMGGSQGASFINDVIWDNLGKLLETRQIIHICGKGKVKSEEEIVTLLGEDGKSFVRRYAAFEYIGKQLKDVYALVSVVVSRSGAVTLAELSALEKPAILIPLGKKVSRGDQIDNALAFLKHHQAYVMNEEDFSVAEFFAKLDDFISRKQESTVPDEVNNLKATDKIISLLEEL